MTPIIVRKSTGELLTSIGASFGGQGRPADTVPVRSSVGVTVQFLDDDGYPTLLDPASGVLTFTAQPAAGDTFTIGAVTYHAVAALSNPTVAGEVLLGAGLPAFLANLAAAVSATTGAGATYGTGTTANPVASAAVYGAAALVFTARYCDASGNAVATTTTSASASFGVATLAGGDVLLLDTKPAGSDDGRLHGRSLHQQPGRHGAARS